MIRENHQFLAKQKRLPLCKACLQPFIKFQSMQKACSQLCAQAVAEAVRYKREMREMRLARAKLAELKRNDRPTMLKRAEAAVNEYVNLRDRDQGCISCHLPATWKGRWNASHYRSVGAASAVRFNLWNIHKACVGCNKHRAGNIHDYRPRLIERIGAEKVDWLKSQNGRTEYTCDYLERLRKVFAKKARRLRQRIEGEA